MAKQKLQTPVKDKSKPVTIKNNDGLVLIKQSAYMAALTKGDK